MYKYLRYNKIGKRLQSLTATLGYHPRVLGNLGGPNYRVPINSWVRPLVIFICYEDEDHQTVVQDDTKVQESLAWNHYFDEKRLAVTPGLTLPSNLEDLIAAGNEEDWIAASSESNNSQSGMHSIFGNSPS